jgi:hypothetical protein
MLSNLLDASHLAFASTFKRIVEPSAPTQWRQGLRGVWLRARRRAGQEKADSLLRKVFGVP